MNNAPIFIVGVPRSGTSLLKLMITNHPRIHIPPISSFIQELYLKYDYFDSKIISKKGDHIIKDLCDHIQKQEWPLKSEDLSQRLKAENFSSVDQMFRRVFEISAEHDGKPRWGDKTPLYLYALDLIIKLFPDAQIIHIIRDGRDVARSVMPISWGPNNVYDAAFQWRDGIRKGQTFKKKARAENFFELKYEDLVERPEFELRKIMNFIKEDYHDEMMNYTENVKKSLPQVSMGWHDLVRKKPTKIRIGRWQTELRREEVKIFEYIAGKELSEYGYELSVDKPRIDDHYKYMYYKITHNLKNLAKRNLFLYSAAKKIGQISK